MRDPRDARPLVAAADAVPGVHRDVRESLSGHTTSLQAVRQRAASRSVCAGTSGAAAGAAAPRTSPSASPMTRHAVTADEAPRTTPTARELLRTGSLPGFNAGWPISGRPWLRARRPQRAVHEPRRCGTCADVELRPKLLLGAARSSLICQLADLVRKRLPRDCHVALRLRHTACSAAELFASMYSSTCSGSALRVQAGGRRRGEWRATARPSRRPKYWYGSVYMPSPWPRIRRTRPSPSLKAV